MKTLSLRYCVKVLVLCIFVSPSFAGGADVSVAPVRAFSGFHIGALAGLVKGRADHDVYYLRHHNDGNDFFTQSTAAQSGVSLFAGLQTGLGLQFGWGFLGVDLTGLYESFPTTNRLNETVVHLAGPAGSNEHTHTATRVYFGPEFSVSVRPGVLVSPSTLLFFRVGWVRNDAKLTANRNDVTSTSMARAGIDQYYVVHKALSGYLLGFGFETRYQDHYSLGAEFDYKKFNGNIQLNATGRGDEFLTYTRTVVSANQFINKSFVVSASYYPNAIVPAKFSPSDEFSGFYIGIAGGARQAEFNLNVSAFNDESGGTGALTKTVDNIANLYDGVGVGEAQLGYGFLLKHKMYLGLEINSDFGRQSKAADTATITTRTPAVHLKVSNQTTVFSKTYYTFSVRPGWFLAEGVLFYGKLGFTQGQLQVRTQGVYDSHTPVATHRSTVFGFNISSGVEMMLGHGFGLYTEYQYSRFGTPVNISIVSASGEDRASAGVTFRNNTVLLGLNWHIRC